MNGIPRPPLRLSSPTLLKNQRDSVIEFPNHKFQISSEAPRSSRRPRGPLARRELRGIQFSKKLSSPLSKIPLNYGGDGGGLRWPFIPPAELGGILECFDKLQAPNPNDQLKGKLLFLTLCSLRYALCYLAIQTSVMSHAVIG